MLGALIQEETNNIIKYWIKFHIKYPHWCWQGGINFPSRSNPSYFIDISIDFWHIRKQFQEFLVKQLSRQIIMQNSKTLKSLSKILQFWENSWILHELWKSQINLSFKILSKTPNENGIFKGRRIMWFLRLTIHFVCLMRPGRLVTAGMAIYDRVAGTTLFNGLFCFKYLKFLTILGLPPRTWMKIQEKPLEVIVMLN